MSDAKSTKILYTVRVGNDVLPLPVYCRRVKLSYKMVLARISRRHLSTARILKAGYLELNPFTEPGDEILQLAHLPPGGIRERK